MRGWTHKPRGSFEALEITPDSFALSKFSLFVFSFCHWFQLRPSVDNNQRARVIPDHEGGAMATWAKAAGGGDDGGAWRATGSWLAVVGRGLERARLATGSTVGGSREE